MKTNERITKLVWYFTIFSILGLIIETVYCFITCDGKIESRKGLLIGPFCPIYGIGAVVIIQALNGLHKKPVKLFIFGTILGSIIEYTLSYTLEAMYGNRFWDYSYLNFNINGRISLIYSMFWGVLSILLIDYIKPAIDHFLNKIKPKIGKKIETALIIFFIIDAVLTVVAVYTYTNIAQDEYNKSLNVQTEVTEDQTTPTEQPEPENTEQPGQEVIAQATMPEIEQTENQNEVEDTNEEVQNTDENAQEQEQSKQDINIFYNKIMPTIFPNIRIKGQNGEEIWVRDIMKKE